MRITLFLKSAMLMLLLLLAGCDNNKASIPSEVGDTLSVTITAPEQANVGDVVNLTATASGNVDISQVTFVWTDESTGDIGLVSSNNTANFTAPANIDMASIKVTAFYNNISASDSAKVTLVTPPTLNVHLAAPTEVNVGDVVNLTATAFGDNIELSQVTFVWENESTLDIHLVSSNNTAYFVAPPSLDMASIKVTATYNNLSASDSANVALVIPVIPPTLNVHLAAPTEVNIGDVVNLTATAFGDNIDLSQVTFVWVNESTGDIGLVSSNDTAYFTAPSNLDIASIKVTATFNNLNASDSAKVILVTPPIPPKINVHLAAPADANIGDVVNLTATVLGDNIDLSQVTFTWEDESAINVGLVTANNTAHFTAPSNLDIASIKVTATYNNISASDTANVTLVTPPIHPTINVHIAAPAEANVGEIVNLTATAFGDNIDLSQVTFTWEDESAINIGLVTANNTAHFIAPSNLDVASIKVTVTYNNISASDSANVTLVTPPILPTINVHLAAPADANIGDVVNLSATAFGNNIDLSQVTFVWVNESTSDIGLVASNNTAYFTAPSNLDMANIKVTASYNQISASDSVKVTLITPEIPPTINVHLAAPDTVNTGDIVNLTATAFGNNIDLSKVSFTWVDESSRDVGLVTSNNTAYFTAPSNLDVASIKVTATYSEISASDTVNVTLIDPVVPTTLNVSITAPDEVVIGDVVNLIATASGENIDIAKVTFVWADESSSNIGLASSNDTAHFIAPINLDVASIKVTATYNQISASDSADVLVVDPILSPVSTYNLSITGSSAAKENDTVIVNAIFTKDSIVDVSASLLWSQTGGPDVAFVEIDGELSFTAPIVTIDTDLEFTVYTTDADGNPLSKPWLITVAPSSINFTNTVSTNAKQVNPGDRVSLSSVAQTTGGGEITYQWQQISGTAVTLINETNKTAEFIAPNLAEVLVFKVTATDPVSGKSSTQKQKVKVNAPAIIAQQGVDHIVYNGHGPIKLNARVSGGTGPFTYLWSQTKGPSTSLTSATDASPSVTPPFVSVATTFEWQVVITDANGLKATTTHSVTVPAVATLTATINGANGSAPLIVTEGDTVHPTVSIKGGTGTYAMQWSSGNVTINNANTTTPSFVLPDITNTQGNDETLYLSVVVSDGSIDDQGKAVTVTAMATFTIKPAFIVNHHQNQPGSNTATGLGATNHQHIIIASQKNLHPVVDIIENAVSGGAYTYQWTIVKPSPIPSDLSIAGADQLHPILSMPLVSTETALELNFIATYTAPSGKVYTANRTLNYLIEPPAAPSKQLLSLSTGGHISVLSGHVVYPTVSALNASGALTYTWVQKSGPMITLNDANTKAPNFTAPQVSGHKDVVLEVTVSDGTATETAQMTFTIDPLNIPALMPIEVTADNDSTVVANVTVNPTATVLHSFGTFTYAWSQKSGESVTLTGATTATPSFVAPNAAGKQIELAVTVTRDSDGAQATDTVIYTLQGAIEITAGSATRSIAEGSVLDLMVGSKNAAGALTYAWTVLDANGLTLPAITDADKSQAFLTMPAVTADTAISIQVEVSDSVNTVKTVIKVVIKNRTLKVDAGAGYKVPLGQPATLHGSVSGGLAPYLYAWRVVPTIPASPSLSNPSSANPTIIAPTLDQASGMQYELTVTDSLGNLAKSSVTLNVIAPTFSVEAGDNLALIENAWGSVSAKAEYNVGTLTWAWTQISGPDVMSTITDADTSNPWFQAPGATPGMFEEVVLEVAATDATSGTTVKDQVKILVQSVPDIFANTQSTYVVKAGETVTLNGLATGVGTVTELKWRPDSSNSLRVGFMHGATSVGNNPGNSLTTTFAAPVVAVDTTLHFTFTATGTGNIDTKRVAIIIKVNPLSVQAGPDRSAVVGETVLLSAVAPAGSTYTWTQTAGTTVTLANSSSATPSFLVPENTLGQELEFQVVATSASTTTDRVKILIQEPKVRIGVPNKWTFEEGDVSKNPIVARISYFNKNTSTLVTPLTVNYTVTPASAAANFSMSANYDRLNIDPTGLVAGDYQINLVAKVTGNVADDGTENVVITVTKPPGKPLPSPIVLSSNPDLSALPGTAQSFSLHVPTITGGTPPLTYTWSLGTNPHSITVTGADTDNPTVNFPAVPNTCNAIEGDITLTVSDSAGKSTTGSIHYKNNPAPQAIQPISCQKCRGPKFICERSHTLMKCDASDLSVAAKAAGRTAADLQYCINDIENLKDGSRYVTRRCATVDDVNNDWLKRIQSTTAGSTLDKQCGKYNVVVLQDAEFKCAFPCKGDNCNLESVPDVTIGLKNGNAQGIEFPVNLVPLPPKAGICP